MNSLNHQSFNDLIDLFLDGEASDVEQHALFAAMAGDSELQEQFQQALAIRDALDARKGSLNLPPQVKASLLERAGMAAPAVIRSSGAGSGSALASGLMTGSGGATILASLLMSTLLVVSIILAVDSSDRPSAPKQESHFNSHSADADHPDRSTPSREPVSSPSTSPTQTSGAAPHAASAMLSHKRIGATKAEMTESSAAVRTPSRREADPEEWIPSGPGLAANSKVQSLNPAGRARELINPASSGMVAQSIGGVSEFLVQPASLQALSGLGGRTNHGSSRSLSRDLVALAIGDGEDLPLRLRRFRFSAGGLSGLAWSGKQEFTREAMPGVDNLTLAASYAIGDHWALGIEYGRELMPLTVLTNNELSQQNHIEWLGLGLNWQAGEGGRLWGFEPYTRVLFGIANAGSLTKLQPGLRYRASSALGLHFGLEASYLFGAWQEVSKLGLVYGVDLHF